MAGYWRKPEETAAAIGPDGFLRTGDIARVDERGYVYIVDRKKDMIIVSGFNVYPNEIEDVVMMHPGVREVGAVGVPDAQVGRSGQDLRRAQGGGPHRGRVDRALPQISDRLQDAAACRVSGVAAAHADRQDSAPRAQGQRGNGRLNLEAGSAEKSRSLPAPKSM